MSISRDKLRINYQKVIMLYIQQSKVIIYANYWLFIADLSSINIHKNKYMYYIYI